MATDQSTTTARPRARSRAAVFRQFQRTAKCPKPIGGAAPARALLGESLPWLAGKLGPAERRALRAIVERADFLEVDGRTYLLAPVNAATIDALAAFEIDGEDLNPDHEVDGCHTERGELDPAEYDGDDADYEPGRAPAEIVERKRAIIAERRAAGEPRQRHTTIATNVETGEQHEVEWIKVERPYRAAQAMPAPIGRRA